MPRPTFKFMQINIFQFKLFLRATHLNLLFRIFYNISIPHRYSIDIMQCVVQMEYADIQFMANRKIAFGESF